MENASRVCSLDYIQSDEVQPAFKFKLIEDLFRSFHVNRINYCHWKSNEHLTAGLEGSTDLDILFDVSQKEKVLSLLFDFNFKLFRAASQRQYTGIEDYIGLDYATGKIFHLHSHFNLSLGENYLKSYQLNIENEILANRVFDKQNGVYRSHPAHELILLFTRYALKQRNRDRIKLFLGKQVSLPTDAVIEYAWLMEQTNMKEVEAFAARIFNNHKEALEIMEGGFNRKQLLLFSTLVSKQFAGQRNFNPLEAQLIRWYREASVKILRKFSKYSRYPVVQKRINPNGGLSIAVIGADGSGKSTIIKNLELSFKSKLDIYQVYFGKGKGNMSLVRKVLFRIKHSGGTVKQVDKYSAKKESVPETKQKKGGKFSVYFSLIEALLVLREKITRYHHMQLAKQKGMLVICDRYPQNQFQGYNDGPSLTEYSQSSNPLLRRIAAREARVYSFFQMNPPDLVFKLVADVDVIAARKPGETSMEMLTKKLDGIKALQYPWPCKMVEINANQPLATVLAEIRKEIWESYKY